MSEKLRREIQDIIYQQMKIYDDFHHKKNIKFTEELNYNYFNDVAKNIIRVVYLEIGKHIIEVEK